MEVTKIPEIKLAGLQIRTSNQKEMNPESAKIGSLWQRFYEELTKSGEMPECSYGVYSNYESDQHGEYDLTVAKTGEFNGEGSIEITIPSGKYLKFEKEGPLPDSALQLWQEIWNYFENTSNHERTFICDFEEYSSMTDVAIYIGIK